MKTDPKGEKNAQAGATAKAAGKAAAKKEKVEKAEQLAQQKAMAKAAKVATQAASKTAQGGIINFFTKKAPVGPPVGALVGPGLMDLEPMDPEARPQYTYGVDVQVCVKKE